MLEATARDRLRSDERALVGDMRRGAERLATLVDNLLTYNRLEAGVVEMRREPLDLRVVVIEAISEIHPLLREKGQEIETNLVRPLPIEGDTRRLGQVIVNLLSNAHAHTRRGTRITIAGWVEDQDVMLAVSDDGPGIPATEREAIFRRFHRLSASGSGTGLGLAICKAIVDLHDGRIWVESESGRGATFRIAMPLREEGKELSE